MTSTTDDPPSAASPRRGDDAGPPPEEDASPSCTAAPPACLLLRAPAPALPYHPGREALAVLASRVRAEVDAENAALSSHNASLRPLRGLMNRVHVCCDGVQQSYVQFDAVSVEACPYW